MLFCSAITQIELPSGLFVQQNLMLQKIIRQISYFTWRPLFVLFHFLHCFSLGCKTKLKLKFAAMNLKNWPDGYGWKSLLLYMLLVRPLHTRNPAHA